MSKGILIPFVRASKAADKLVAIFGKYCFKIEIAGSIRRQCAKVHDVDIVLVPTNHDKLAEFLKEKFGVTMGECITKLDYNRIPVQLYTTNSRNWGSALQMWTGPMTLNISLRNKAKAIGGSLSQYGIKLRDGSVKSFQTEIELFHYLKVRFVEPNKRGGSEVKIYRKAATQAIPQSVAPSAPVAPKTEPAKEPVPPKGNTWGDKATPRQLWALYKLTGKDHRQMNLTKRQASDMIAPLMEKVRNKQAAKQQATPAPSQPQTPVSNRRTIAIKK